MVINQPQMYKQPENEEESLDVSLKNEKNKSIAMKSLSIKFRAMLEAHKLKLKKLREQFSMNLMTDKLREDGSVYCYCLADINNNVSDTNAIVCDSKNCKIIWFHKEHVQMEKVGNSLVCKECAKKMKEEGEDNL